MGARDVQTFYLRLGLPAVSFIRHPDAFIGPWDQGLSNGVGSGARYMGPLQANGVPAQRSASTTWSAVPAGTDQFLAFAQFLSDPLEGASIPAGPWEVSYAVKLANASLTLKWQAFAALYVIDGTHGGIRGTIFNTQAINGAAQNSVDERTTINQFVPGYAINTLASDFLALEITIQVQNTGGAPVVPQATVYSDGMIPIISLYDITGSPLGLLRAPIPLTHTLPAPYEPPAPSVTTIQARTQAIDWFPPNTFHEFGHDDAGQSSPDSELMDWWADIFKRLFWDLIDIWERELDPSRAILKLADWRALFQIISNPQKADDLRALVVARLREYGQGSTLFAIAAAVGIDLGYSDPTTLEILEISASTLRAAVQHPFPIGTPIAIADFAGGGTRLLAPHLYDGGPVWNSGLWMSLVFNVAAGKHISVKVTAPDGFQKTWNPIALYHEVTTAILFGVEFAGHPVHGNWKVEIFRDNGSPAVNLVGCTLYVPGCPRYDVTQPTPQPIGPPWPARVPNVSRNCGLGRWKQWWGVYVDPALTGIASASDLREAQQALTRIRHAYQGANLILTKAPVPGTFLALPGMMIPGT